MGGAPCPHAPSTDHPTPPLNQNDPLSHLRSPSHAPALAVRTLRGAWLFDVGEDTQRALARTPLVKAGRLDAAFLSGAAAAGLAGLPGVLCIASAARDAEGGLSHGTPVHVFGPPGVAEYLE
jgi:ribonuclease BN (tRNA processing enzyme)